MTDDDIKRFCKNSYILGVNFAIIYDEELWKKHDAKSCAKLHALEAQIRDAMPHVRIVGKFLAMVRGTDAFTEIHDRLLMEYREQGANESQALQLTNNVIEAAIGAYEDKMSR